MEYGIIIVIAYLCGCFNGSYFIGKKKYGQDIRELGSTNAGARNAGRVFGKSAFVYTALLDALKTILPLTIGIIWQVPDWMLGCVALAVMAGHIWPFQLQWRGGKGVIVYVASGLVLIPSALLAAGVVLAVGYLVTRKFTASGLPALAMLPIGLVVQGDYTLAGFFSVMLIIVVLAHQGGD